MVVKIKIKIFFFLNPNKTSATAIKHSAAELARGSLMLQVCTGYI